MSKRKTAKKPAATKRDTTSRRLRSQIGRLDKELVKQLNERAQLVVDLCRQKDSAEDLVDDPEVMSKLEAANRGLLDNACLRAVFHELFSGTRQLVAQRRTAYLGPPYSYSHLAAMKEFGLSAELVPVSTITAVFEEVNQGQVELGLVPIENSTDGRIVDTLDMFSRLPVKICGEVQMRIHHCLLGRSPRADIRRVYSKPQAVSQCRDWLAKHLPQARIEEMTSTAAAAELAVEHPAAAAIASHQAGVHYGLNVIASNIEDNKDNLTRFAVIGTEPAPRTGKDKTALMFEISHRPGALADSMAIFKRARLNLTWIESFPMRGTKSEYIFFVEFEGHPTDVRARRALASLRKKVVRLEVLGACARTEPVG